MAYFIQMPWQFHESDPAERKTGFGGIALLSLDCDQTAMFSDDSLGVPETHPAGPSK